MIYKITEMQSTKVFKSVQNENGITRGKQMVYMSLKAWDNHET